MQSAKPAEAGGELRCRVITPARIVFDEAVEAVEAATPDGVLEMLARFEPTVSPLSVGVMRVKTRDGGVTELAIHGGYLDMNGRMLVVLADSAEIGGEIDVERARRSLARAKALLADVTSERGAAVDVDRARLALLRALTRLRLAGEAAE